MKRAEFVRFPKIADNRVQMFEIGLFQFVREPFLGLDDFKMAQFVGIEYGNGNSRNTLASDRC